MAIHTAYSVGMNSAYAPTTRRSPRLPASAAKTPRRRRPATVDHPMPAAPAVTVTSVRHENGLVTATGLGGTWARHVWGQGECHAFPAWRSRRGPDADRNC